MSCDNTGLPSGRYADTCDLYNVFGQQNVNAWSDADANLNGSPNTDRIQASFNYADSLIQSYFAQYGNFVVPLNPIGVSIPLVARWSAVITGAYLYRSRGIRDEGDLTGDHLSRMEKDVWDEIRRFSSLRLIQATNRWPTSGGPTVSMPFRAY